MKSVNAIPYLLVGLLCMGGCAGMTQQPKSYNTAANPALSISALRQKVPQDIAIVVDPAIVNPLHRSRSNDMVVVDVPNFREALADTVQKALAPQFNSATVQEAETGKGLELVIIDAKYPNETDVLAYHFALIYDGNVQFEAKGETVPVTKAMAVSAATWQDEMAKMTLEYVESNINELAERVRDELLMNDKLNDFWSQFSADAAAPATEE